MDITVLGILMCMVSSSLTFYSNSSPNISSVLDRLLGGYDDRFRPNFGGPPVIVKVSMHALDAYGISEKNSELTVELYFRQSWQDDRLSFQAPRGVDYIPISANFMSKIWKPDTFFVNARRSSFHTVSSPSSFMRIYPNGNITYSTRLTVTASCRMNLINFPFDGQQCNLQLESYGYNMKDIQYNFRSGNSAFSASPEYSSNKFMLLGYRVFEQTVPHNSINYSRLQVELHLKRVSTSYIISIYTPAIILVIVSCTSFLIASHSTRIIVNALIFFMLLTMTVTNAIVIPSVKAIDVFMLFSMFINFLIWIFHVASPKTGKQVEEKKEPENGEIHFTLPMAFNKYAKLIFPVVYLLGNFIYWTGYFFSSSPDFNDMVPFITE